MQDFFEGNNRTASIEQQMTNDYMVAFFDGDTSNTQYETFHTLEKAQDASSRWINHDYTPL